MTDHPEPTQSKPVLDGADQDFSDGGTSKLEAMDLREAGREDEIKPPDNDKQ